jgi:hypothetical protein
MLAVFANLHATKTGDDSTGSGYAHGRSRDVET